MSRIHSFLHKAKILLKINWIKSAYINFRLLPFSQATRFPFIVRGKLKIRSLSGRVRLNCKPRFGMFGIGIDVDAMPISLVPAQLLIKGELILNGDVILNQGANLVVWSRATMILGNDVMICSGVLLKAVNKVSVGDHVMISSGCFIMDSSIHALYNLESLEVAPIHGEIIIGNNVWFNMRTSIIKWGVVPNGCVTTQYTYIGKPFGMEDSNCLLAGQPAKVIKRNITQVHNLTTERYLNQYFLRNRNSISYKLNQNQIKEENLCQKILR